MNRFFKLASKGGDAVAGAIVLLILSPILVPMAAIGWVIEQFDSRDAEREIKPKKSVAEILAEARRKKQ
jgi:Na+-transporting methylmalonyl-CoA/oxaloacetate decarboxylase gamma subunit